MRKLSFILLAVTAATLGVLSVASVPASLYSGAPMTVLWAATAITAVTYMVQCRLWRRPWLAGIHLSLLVILAGALVTHLCGKSDRLTLIPAESAAIDGHIFLLTRFNIEYYPGTPAPADYITEFTLDGTPERVSMNRPVIAGGMRIFQSAYNPAEGSSTLTVQRDHAGTAVSYTGYFMLWISMLVYGLRKLRRKGAATAAVCLLGATFGAMAAPVTIPRASADSLGQLLIYSNGRVTRLENLADDFTLKTTGATTYRGLTGTQVLAGWLVCYDSWKNEPAIRFKDTASRRRMGLEGRYARLTDFFSSTNDYLFDGPEYTEANEKFGLVSTAATGSLWKVFPARGADGSVQWYAPVDETGTELELDNWHVVRHSFDYLAELAGTGRWDEFNSAVGKIALYQRRQLGASAPSQWRLGAESLFTRLAGRRWGFAALILGGVCLFLWPRRRPAVILAALGTAWVTFIVVLNAIAGARVPLSNGFETMQAIALCCLALALAQALRRKPELAATGILTGGLALLVAFMGTRNPQLTPLMPVLRSPLLSVHVFAMVLAYALTAVCALCGAGWLCGRRNLLSFARKALLPAVMLMAFGIFIGAIWANQSWGRYWGWDPKETWALITMITYAIALHARSLPLLRGDRFFAWYILLSFASVLMTYFGVNLLPGLHSYA